MSDETVYPLLNMTFFYRRWFDLLEQTSPRPGEVGYMIFLAHRAFGELGEMQLRFLIEDASGVWRAWPECVFAAPSPASFRDAVAIQQVLDHLFAPAQENAAAESAPAILALREVLPEDLLSRCIEGSGVGGEVLLAAHHEAGGASPPVSDVFQFARTWTGMLAAEEPRTGAFITMLSFAIEHWGSVETQLGMFFELATETWLRWPTRVFETPGLDRGTLGGTSLSQTRLLSHFTDLTNARSFPLLELLPPEILMRWLPGVTVLDAEGALDAEDYGSGACDIARFVPLFDGVDDVATLTLGVSMLREHRELRDRSASVMSATSFGHANPEQYNDSIDALDFAMVQRLGVLAARGARVVLSPALVRLLMSHRTSALWPDLFRSAAGVELDGFDLLSDFYLAGEELPVVGATLEGEGRLRALLTDELERLTLSHAPDAVFEQLLLGADQLSGLRELHLHRVEPGGRGVLSGLVRVDASALQRLEALSFIEMKLEDAGLLLLPEAPFEWVRSLDLRGNPGITGDGLKALFSHWKLSEVESLNIDGMLANRILALGEATYSNSLRSLSARHCAIDPVAAEEISRVDGFVSLGELDLSNNALGDRGVTAIATWPRLRRLKSLTLENVSVGDEGTRSIANSVSLQKLEHLDLHHNQLSAVGIRALAEGRLENLRALDVGLNDLDLASLRRLITAPVLSNLKYLCLGSNLDGSILEVILEESELFRLKTLVVLVNTLLPKHAEVFRQVSSMPALERIEVFVRHPKHQIELPHLPFMPMVYFRSMQQLDERAKLGATLGPLKRLFEQASRA